MKKRTRYPHISLLSFFAKYLEFGYEKYIGLWHNLSGFISSEGHFFFLLLSFFLKGNFHQLALKFSKFAHRMIDTKHIFTVTILFKKLESNCGNLATNYV